MIESLKYYILAFVGNASVLTTTYLTNFDSPNCVCSKSESDYHYLFEWLLYTHICLTLFDTPRQLPCSVCLQTLLFGDDSQSLSDNNLSFEAVQSFIIASKRFNKEFGEGRAYGNYYCTRFKIVSLETP